MDFVEFITKLAPEGETALLVRQKPTLDAGGELQFHEDGAIKAKWPAFLPERAKMRPGQAWYANTASFIIERFTEGKVSASRANCEYVLVMVLDDVGDSIKAPKTPPLAPTWIMETSPGSFQWGYVFSEQPTKAEYSAVISAIAAAGYSDPGAINPVRNFRIPGSVNLKPGKNAFAARLVEFHPERDFTLEEICAALGVTLGPVSSDGVKPIRLSDTGSDDVLTWLSAQGLVLSPPNLEGWAGVVCPNHEQHSDGNPEGRYLASTRAYCCYHGHCEDWNSARFLEWVGEQGGPKHTPGLREELLSARMSAALATIAPSEAFPDDAQRVIEEVERKEAGRVERSQWFERFAYVQVDDSYFDMETRREVSRQSFNAIFRHIPCMSIHGQKSRRVEASTCFDENRQAKGGRLLYGITYAAGESVLVSRDGEVYGNRWRDARPRPAPGQEWTGDITPWLQHCETLVPEVSEREHLFDIMAYKLQRPDVKINHAVLHGGTQGCGKDTMWAPFLWAVCGPGLKNRGLLDSNTINGQWGYALESEILIINELKEPEAAQRRALANNLKPIIAAPPEMLSINRKGLHPYDMVNRLFVLAFTNESIPLTIDSQDRRWFAVWSHAPKMSDGDGRALWDWFKAGGFQRIAGWLYRRDVSKFNPGAAPAWTEFKHNLVEHGMSMAESYLVELIRTGRDEFSRGVVGSPFHAVCDRVAGRAPAGVKVPQAALLHALREAGWIDLGRVGSHDYPTKKHIFCAPNMTHFPKSELRRMIEEPSSGPSVALKVVGR